MAPAVPRGTHAQAGAHAAGQRRGSGGAGVWGGDVDVWGRALSWSNTDWLVVLQLGLGFQGRCTEVQP